MTQRILTPTPTPGQTAPAHLEPGRPNPLSDRQAVSLSRLAVAALLWGEPPACTFDRADLSNALARLGEMQTRLDRNACGLSASESEAQDDL